MREVDLQKNAPKIQFKSPKVQVYSFYFLEENCRTPLKPHGALSYFLLKNLTNKLLHTREDVLFLTPNGLKNRMIAHTPLLRIHHGS